MGPHPAVAAVRHAVRRSLAGLAPGELVLVACSGGADSLALAAAAAFEAPRAGLRAGGVIVDHGLQAGSAEVAGKVTATLGGLGLTPVLTMAVQVARPGGSGSYAGPEGAARAARYAALRSAAESAGAAAMLLGHTLDDQAETVLLGLARGSGARSLAGMAVSSGLYRRPFLELRRDQTRSACVALGLLPWDDPQNEDPAFARVRVRQDAMPALQAALGPGVAEALARTAQLLRADADALDQLATEAAARISSGSASQIPPRDVSSIMIAKSLSAESRQTLRDHDAAAGQSAAGHSGAGAAASGWPVGELAALPAAIRHRVLRTAALAAGCPAGALSARHIASLDGLVCDWHGQRWIDLPGAVRCQRRYGRLLFTAAGVPGADSGASTAGVPGADSGASTAGVPAVAPQASTAPRSEEQGGRE